MSTVAVFGASGHTGQFVVAELLRRGYGVISIGRDGSLDRALVDASAVINCAGPFLDTAHAVASAALRARIHYLDITAEQASAQATLQEFGAAAVDAGVLVIPAMGFYGGFLDLLASVAVGEWESADDIQIGIALDRWWPTRGTRETGRRNTAQRLIIRDGELAPLGELAQSSWNFAEPFGRQEMTSVPFSEMVLIARHIRASQVRTYLSNTALSDVRDPSTPPPVAVDEKGRSAQRFLVEVRARKGSEQRFVRARGGDIYAFTAPLVVEAVDRILTGATSRRGAAAPGEVFDAVSYLRALEPEHVVLELDSTS